MLLFLVVWTSGRKADLVWEGLANGKQTDALELPSSSWQLGSPQVFPSASSLLAEMGVRLLAAATTSHRQGTPQRNVEPGRSMDMFNHQEGTRQSDRSCMGPEANEHTRCLPRKC